MRAVVTAGHGGYEQLRLRTDVAVPDPGPGEVLVAVASSSVNATDLNTRIGWYSRGDADTAWTGEPIRFPRIQGIDACGRIVAVGDRVDSGRVGERVLIEPAIRDPEWIPHRARYLGSELDGSFAEYLVVPSAHAWAVDSPLTDLELGVLPCAYGTALNLLTHAGVAPGQRVLITGASGGVGAAAVQLAALRGATVVAAASDTKHAAILALGADLAIGRHADPCDVGGPDHFDVIVDLVGGPRWPRLLDAIAPGGHYVVSGAIGGPQVELDLRTLYLKDVTLRGATIAEPAVFAELVALAESGRLAPRIAHVFELGQIVAAQQLFEAKQFVGKIALRVAGTDA